jgi:hypothetical protein
VLFSSFLSDFFLKLFYYPQVKEEGLYRIGGADSFRTALQERRRRRRQRKVCGMRKRTGGVEWSCWVM